MLQDSPTTLLLEPADCTGKRIRVAADDKIIQLGDATDGFVHGQHVSILNDGTTSFSFDITLTSTSNINIVGGRTTLDPGNVAHLYFWVNPPTQDTWDIEIHPQSLDHLTDVNASAPVIGDVLTYDGDSWAPTPPSVGGSRIHAFELGMVATSHSFDGSVISDWVIGNIHTAPAPQFVRQSLALTNQFELLEAGTYRIVATAVISAAGETLVFPDDLTAFGMELVHTGGTVFGPNPSYHTAFSSGTGTRTNLQGFAPAPASAGGSAITWTDQYILQAPVGATFTPAMYVYNYNNTTAEYGVAMTVVIEKINNDSGV